MATIKRYGITFHSDFKLLFKGFSAITLFGHVFTRMSFKNLEKYLDTPVGRIMVNHEGIHMLQAESFKLGYIGFYIYYLFYWVKNLFKYGFTHEAYRNIPFEKEAYANEKNPLYSQTQWEKYIQSV